MKQLLEDGTAQIVGCCKRIKIARLNQMKKKQNILDKKKKKIGKEIFRWLICVILGPIIITSIFVQCGVSFNSFWIKGIAFVLTAILTSVLYKKSYEVFK